MLRPPREPRSRANIIGRPILYLARLRFVAQARAEPRGRPSVSASLQACVPTRSGSAGRRCTAHDEKGPSVCDWPRLSTSCVDRAAWSSVDWLRSAAALASDCRRSAPRAFVGLGQRIVRASRQGKTTRGSFVGPRRGTPRRSRLRTGSRAPSAGSVRPPHASGRSDDRPWLELRCESAASRQGLAARHDAAP